MREAAAQFNRYNSTRIVVAEKRLASEKVVGWFDVNNPQGFCLAVARSFGATTETRDGVIYLTLKSGKQKSPSRASL